MLTDDQVAALAPDPASLKAGKDLAKPGKWLTLGSTPQALWGECQGSGANPYQAQVDLGNLGSKCTCPSRKFPCKHALGLMFLAANQPAALAAAAPPQWVEEWLAKRAANAEKKVKAATEEAPPEEPAKRAKAAAKTAEKRQARVADGVAELQLWLKDLLRGGLLTMPEKPPGFWQNVAARMVDAQAPGLANGVRSLADLDFYADQWQPVALEKLTRLYLLTLAYQNLDTLPTDLQSEVNNLVGFNQKAEELKAQTGVTGRWAVLSKQTRTDDKLTTEKYWLIHAETARPALILNFYFVGNPTPLALVPGATLEAELVYYQAALPLRALIKQSTLVKQATLPMGAGTWGLLEQTHAAGLARNPWYNEWPVGAMGFTPLWSNQRLWLSDQEGRVRPLQTDPDSRWALLAHSGGQPVNLALLYRADQCQVLGYWHGTSYQPLGDGKLA